jgi:glyoxylase-like metal-dependent hydrolase (beta-lactamase superfamily II)
MNRTTEALIAAALGTLVATALPNGANAQVRTADLVARGIPRDSFPRIIKLAENVYGYEEIRSPGFTTVSIFVTGTDGVLLADGQGSVPATRTMLERIRTVTALPIRWYVVGSDHGDHTAGNSVLPAGIRWIMHPTSRTQLRLDSVPAMTGEREVIDVGGTTVEVLFMGRAHTGGDLMVHLPREKILFMSEAYLNRVFPAMRSAYPTEWLALLDKALAMDVAHYIPGHGFIETAAVSREELGTFRTALAYTIEEVKRLHARGLTVDAAIAAADWKEYSQWLLAQQQGPIAVRRIYDEIAGRLRQQ